MYKKSPLNGFPWNEALTLTRVRRSTNLRAPCRLPKSRAPFLSNTTPKPTLSRSSPNYLSARSNETARGIHAREHSVECIGFFTPRSRLCELKADSLAISRGILKGSDWPDRRESCFSIRSSVAFRSCSCFRILASHWIYCCRFSLSYWSSSAMVRRVSDSEGSSGVPPCCFFTSLAHSGTQNYTRSHGKESGTRV